jgi:hypothetical protein
MFDSNLSKIRPKLRTQGAVTGNFGRSKVRANSALAEIGETQLETVRIAPRSEYIRRMIRLLETTTDQKLRNFAYFELHRLNCFQERRVAPGRTAEPFKGPTGAS